jgi:16S rRNA U516 pseudouridylate synthase RsuA-like enzyme
VARLVRVRIGPLRLDLASGAVRPLTGAEVRRLGASTYQPETAASARRGTP